MKKAVLITGYAGFLGFNLTKKMIDQGYLVVGIDDFSNEEVVTTSFPEITKLVKKGKIVPLDLMDCNGSVLHAIPRNAAVEYVFHMASLASPKQYKEKPLHTMVTNSVGTNNMLTVAKEFDARLIYASTSEVYGQPPPEEHPQREEYNGNVSLFGSRASYDQAKRFGETLVRVWNQEKDTTHKVVRIFNTYGPYMTPNDGRVIPTLLVQLLRNQPFTVYGGDQTRTLSYVQDTIDGIWAVAKSNNEHDTFNVGGDQEITINDLVRFISETYDKDRKILTTPFDQEEPVRRKPDLTRLRELGWAPLFNLGEGLSLTVEWFRGLQKKGIL